MYKLEIRRQLLHVFYGLSLIAFHKQGVINNVFLLALLVGGFVISYFIQRKRMTLIARFLSIFERKHHLEAFPGKGVLFFTLGAYLTLMLFEANVAYAGIAILSVGDAISNIMGRHFGYTKIKLNPHKFIEGNLLGILASMPVAYFFFPHFFAVFAASTVGMFLEIPNIKLFGFEIDDNLIIPVGAAFTLSLFA